MKKFLIVTCGVLIGAGAFGGAVYLAMWLLLASFGPFGQGEDEISMYVGIYLITLLILSLTGAVLGRRYALKRLNS